MRDAAVLAGRTVSGWTPPVEVVRGGRRVLHAGDVRTVDAAQLARAEQQAAAQESQELEQLLEQAREQGRAQGVASARAEGEGAVLRAAAALERLEAEVGAREASDVTALTDAVLTLGLQVAEWALRRELAEDAGRSLLVRLEAGLTALLPSPTTRISVSHADCPLVTEWAERRGRLGTVVVADHRLEPGDAVVVTDAGRAEVTVAAALHAAAEALGLPPTASTA